MLGSRAFQLQYDMTRANYCFFLEENKVNCIHTAESAER